MIVLAACVLIAFADPGHPHHERAKRILRRSEHLAVSALTGAEVMVDPAKTHRQGEWLDFLAAFGIEVLPLAGDDMADLAVLRRTAGLKMPDAVVLHTSRRRGATLATFDERLSAVAARLGVAVEAGAEPR